MNTSAGIEAPRVVCKYARLDYAIQESRGLVRELLLGAPIAGDRKYLSCDIKWQHLSPGEHTCIPGWHADTRSDPRALHHLIVFGENRTEFRRASGLHWVIPHGEWHSYGHDLHRGPLVRAEENRLLVRVTESDVVRGNVRFRHLTEPSD